MKVKQIPIDDVIPYARNPRKNGNAIAKVAASLKEFGWQQPIVVDSEMVVIAGHTRLAAARKLGMEKVPVVIADGLTPSQVKAYRLADNRVSQEAQWDDELLSVELEELLADGYNLSETGFDEGELASLLAQEIEGLTDEDSVPEVPETPKTVEGDIWILGRHRLMCGDSTSIDAVEKLMDGKKADVLFTDPPYGYKYQSNYQKKHSMLINDDVHLDFMPSAIPFMFDNSCAFIFGSFQSISRWIDYVGSHLSYKNLIVWKKNNWSMGDLKGAFAGQHELIIFAHKGKIDLIGKRDPDVWVFDRVPPDIHPTQKPIEMIEYALSKVKSGFVLDLFGGSGSTLIACEKTNRDCNMMELDPKYCDVIIKRWQDFAGQKAIHAETGEKFDG